jgi:hypothetical protein
MEPRTYLAAWQTPRASSNSAAKRIFHEREKTIGSPEELTDLRSAVLPLLGPAGSFKVDHAMVMITLPDSQLRKVADALLAVVASFGYILYDLEAGLLVVPMTKLAAPRPPSWTEPAPEARSPADVPLPAEKGRGAWRAGDPRPPEVERRMHVSPELEALVPGGLVDSTGRPSSVRATEWAAPAVNRALRAVGVRPRDAVVVNALGGKRRGVHAVTIFGVPGVAADALAAAFEPSIARPRGGGRWQLRDVAGRAVWWAQTKGEPFGWEYEVAWWARDGLVVWVAGPTAWLEGAVAGLP